MRQVPNYVKLGLLLAPLVLVIAVVGDAFGCWQRPSG